MKVNAPDLRKIFPRSPHETLGGYVHLPRMIDKARAKLAGKLGEYIWNCPLDQRLMPFIRVTEPELFAAIRKARNDAEVLAWVQRRARRSPAEIKRWSEAMRARAPRTQKQKEWFAKRCAQLGRNPGELRTYFDLLDAEEKRK